MNSLLPDISAGILANTMYTIELSVTWHLCRYTGQLLAQDVVVGVEEGQLIHHGLFGDKVEDLRKFPVLNNRHTPDGVLPLDPVHDHHFIAVRAAADPAQAAEFERARHAVEAFSQTVEAADWPQARNHKANLKMSKPFRWMPGCSLRLWDWLSVCVCVCVCVCVWVLSIRQSTTYSCHTPLKKIKWGIFLGFLFTVNRGSEYKEVPIR